MYIHVCHGHYIHVTKNGGLPGTYNYSTLILHFFVQLLYRTSQSEKLKSRVIPPGSYQRIIKNLSKNTSMDRIGRVVYKSCLKESVNKSIFTEVKKECSLLCSRKDASILRNISSDNLATFSIDNLNAEIQNKAPLLHGILHHAVKGSNIGTVVATAVALKFRNNQMSAFHHILAQILDRGGATDEVYFHVYMFTVSHHIASQCYI